MLHLLSNVTGRRLSPIDKNCINSDVDHTRWSNMITDKTRSPMSSQKTGWLLYLQGSMLQHLPLSNTIKESISIKLQEGIPIERIMHGMTFKSIDHWICYTMTCLMVHLVEWYGGTMTFLDVTYKVTKYAIPLCMRTKFCVSLTVNINIHTYLILNSKARVGRIS